MLVGWHPARRLVTALPMGRKRAATKRNVSLREHARRARAENFGYDTSSMAEGKGEYGWEKHFSEHQRTWEAIRSLTNHAKLADRRIAALHQAQSETNASVKDLVSAIRDLIDRIPPENLR